MMMQETPRDVLHRTYNEQGYDVMNTGGGCTAFKRDLPDETFVLITRYMDPSTPDSLDEMVDAGHYYPDGNECIAFRSGITSAEAIKWGIELEQHARRLMELADDDKPLGWQPKLKEQDDPPVFTWGADRVIGKPQVEHMISQYLVDILDGEHIPVVTGSNGEQYVIRVTATLEKKDA